jgi:hypothetical protein
LPAAGKPTCSRRSGLALAHSRQEAWQRALENAVSNFGDVVVLLASTFAFVALPDAGTISADEFARLKQKAPG